MNENFDLKYLRFGGRFSKINTSCAIRSALCCFSTFSTSFFYPSVKTVFKASYDG